MLVVEVFWLAVVIHQWTVTHLLQHDCQKHDLWMQERCQMSKRRLVVDRLFGANGFVPLGLVGFPVERKILPRHRNFHQTLSSSYRYHSLFILWTTNAIVQYKDQHTQHIDQPFLFTEIGYPMDSLPYPDRYWRTRDFDTGVASSRQRIKIRQAFHMTRKKNKQCVDIEMFDNQLFECYLCVLSAMGLDYFNIAVLSPHEHQDQIKKIHTHEDESKQTKAVRNHLAIQQSPVMLEVSLRSLGGWIGLLWHENWIRKVLAQNNNTPPDEGTNRILRQAVNKLLLIRSCWLKQYRYSTINMVY